MKVQSGFDMQKILKSIFKLFIIIHIIFCSIQLILSFTLDNMNTKYRGELVSIAEIINESNLSSKISTNKSVADIFYNINSTIIEITSQYMLNINTESILKYTGVEDKITEDTLHKINDNNRNIDEAVYKLCNSIENIEYVGENFVFTLPLLRGAIDNKDNIKISNEELKNTNKDEIPDLVYSSLDKLEDSIDKLDISKPAEVLLIVSIISDITIYLGFYTFIIFVLFIVYVGVLQLLFNKTDKFNSKQIKELLNRNKIIYE